MSLLAQAEEIQTVARPVAVQVTKTIVIDMASLPKFAAKLEKAFTGLTLNRNAIEKGGLTPSGDKIVPYAVLQKNPTGSATVYYNGKAVLSGALASFEF